MCRARSRGAAGRYLFETLTDVLPHTQRRVWTITHARREVPHHHCARPPCVGGDQTSSPSSRSVTSAAIGLRSLRVNVTWAKSG